MIGNDIHNLASTLWGINRSLTGEGVRETLNILRDILPKLTLHEVPTGTKVFDWTVPREWKVNDAYIIDPEGNKICSFKQNNLHLLGYSTPIQKELGLNELQEHLHSLSDQPTAIPYVTSYYKERWGFCISEDERQSLKDGRYYVHIDTELFEGHLTYGELLMKGQSSEEVFMSTYICHPSMANNELSGPTVTTFLAKWLLEQDSLRYSYRIVFIPETIGSITYLSEHLDNLKKNVFSGFNVTCIGDNRAYSFLPSRDGNTISDHIAQHVLRWIEPNYKKYTWNDRGSDERQYCAPKVDLPIATIMRTKYGQYPEYHTSLDNLTDVVTPEGLQGGYTALRRALEAIERNIYPEVQVFGEPQLGKRGLYPTLSQKNGSDEVRLMMNLISYSDGKKCLLEIADLCGVPIWDLYPIVDKLKQHSLLSWYEKTIPQT